MSSERGGLSLALAPAPRLSRRLRVVATALLLVVAFVVVLTVTGLGGGRSLVGLVSLSVVALALVVLAAILVRAAAAGPGRLERADDALVLVQPVLLRRPLVVPVAAVRTVLVEPGDPPAVAAGEGLPPALQPRFPLVETGGDPAWLHPGARSALVVLDAVDELPDTAVVLRGPFALGAQPRRLVALVVGNEELRALDRCAGFLLRFAAPEAAADAMAAWGLDRPLTLAEAGGLDAMTAERRWFGAGRARP